MAVLPQLTAVATGPSSRDCVFLLQTPHLAGGIGPCCAECLPGMDLTEDGSEQQRPYRQAGCPLKKKVIENCTFLSGPKPGSQQGLDLGWEPLTTVEMAPWKLLARESDLAIDEINASLSCGPGGRKQERVFPDCGPLQMPTTHTR